MELTNPNYVPDKINIKSNKPMKMQVSITDMNIFKDTINIIIELAKDESIDKDIRMRYFNKLMKVIDIKDYHIEL